MWKIADSPTISMPQQAAASPIPAPSLESPKAPGLKGPKGLAPKANYSRVNTGAPPTSSDIAATQKSISPDTMGMLPAKRASKEEMMSANVTRRMTLNELIKAAAEGVASNAALMSEVRTKEEPVVKQASSDTGYSKEYVEKLAGAVEYLLNIEKEAADEVTATGPGDHTGPGEGPGALEVSQAKGGDNAIEAGQTGQATAQHQSPKDPPLQKDPSRSADPGTGLETNDDTMLPDYPTKLSGEAPIELIRKVASEKKAEDAISPAKISAGADVEPDASASGEAGGSPAGGMPEGPRGLVGSNDSAIDYTKGEAKKTVQPGVAAVLAEPAQTSSTDNVLQKALDNTGAAGVKISSATKTAAARALLEKLAAEVDAKKKKTAIGGPGTYQAPPVGGATASGAM